MKLVDGCDGFLGRCCWWFCAAEAGDPLMSLAVSIWWCEMVVGWQIYQWRGEWPAVGGDAICRRGCCKAMSWVLVAIGDAQSALS